MAYQQLINGELVDGSATFPIFNPSTLEEIGKCPHASQAQVDAAVDAAAAAQADWGAMPIQKRKGIVRKALKVLKDNADDLAKLLTAEQGKPLDQAGMTGEIAWTLGGQEAVLKDLNLKPERISDETMVYRRPVGVVVGITPWNFPILCTVQKWGPALTLGNTFVHKPSPFTPLTGMKMGMLLKDVFPKGVFNVIGGDDKQAFNVGAHLSAHPKVNHVSFTGSVPTGKKIMTACAAGMRRVTLEAGGNDAAIILPGCDPKKIAPGLFQGAFINNGQTCCAAKRTYVHESIYDEVVAELVKIATSMKVGDGTAEGTQLGPINNKMQYDKVMGFLADTKKEKDAKFECGGGKVEGLKGYFIEPTIVSGAKEGMRIVDEEQFGPVMPIIKYSDEADALRRANDSAYGLGGSVWCAEKDLGKARRMAAQIKAGTVWVNEHASGGGGPFGGFKESGIGREAGGADIHTYTEIQTMKMPAREKRLDPTDRKSKKTYAKKEFLDFYGQKQGQRMWDKAGTKQEPKKAKKETPVAKE